MNSVAIRRKKANPRPAIGRSVEEALLLRHLMKSQSQTRITDKEIDGNDPKTWPKVRSSNIFGNEQLLLVDSQTSQRPTSKMNSIFPSDSTQKPGSSSRAKNNNDHDSEQDQDVLVQAMKEYCVGLEQRVKELETKLQIMTTLVKQDSIKSSHLQRRLSACNLKESSAKESISTAAALVHEGYIADADPLDKSMPYRSDLTDSLTSIDVKVLGLRELFRSNDPFLVRNKAATTIIAMIRGFLARRRYVHYHHNMKAYRWSRCKLVVFVLDQWLAKQTRYDVGVRRLHLMRDMKVSLAIFKKWSHITKQNSPMRSRIRDKALDMHLNKQRRLLSWAFNSFRMGCVGQSSQRAIKEQRRRIIENIRAELRATHAQNGDTLGVISEDEVRRMTYRRIVTSHLEKRKNDTVQRIFRILQQNVKRANNLAIKASYMWFKVYILFPIMIIYMHHGMLL